MKKVMIRDIPENISPLHEHPLLHRIYAARGVKEPQEIEYELKHLLPFNSLKGIEKAVDVLVNALKEKQKIVIIGDFDTDGATSTALAVLVLKAFGIEEVSYLIPGRFEYGYGLSPEIVKVAAEQKPDLIVTVDNGISSIEGVRTANELGIKVLVTDHHLPGDELPDALAIVNPNQNGDEFPGKSLAGVGVIFYLMLALRAKLREIDWFNSQEISEPNMAQFLDLVALGTVADAVTLDHTNRILVSEGLERMRDGKGRLGINALFSGARRNFEKASVYDMGFVIAPRLNASGRLESMSLGVECLLTDDVENARSLAKKLSALNDERRSIESDMQKQAERILSEYEINQNMPAGVCIYEESWHQGVLGILSSRIKDKLNRPVITFASVGDNEIKGSARSVGSVHIREVLNEIASENPGLISRFGGHAMAAGVSLNRENYEMFSQIFAEKVDRCIKSDDREGVIHTDGEVEPEYLNIETAELVQKAGPWGAGFVEPLFYGEYIIVRQSLVGSKHLKLVLRDEDSGEEFDAIHFNADLKVWPNSRFSKLKIVYRLNINEYNGRHSFQLIISEIIFYE